VRRAKILATLGPVSRDQVVIEALLAAGVNGVRINMSHGSREEKGEDIRRARAAAQKLNRPLAILVDLSGPKIRTRQLKNAQPVTLEAGAVFVLTTREIIGDSKQVATNYPELPQVLKAGDRILLDDGAIALSVESTTDYEVVCHVINGGVLGERKGINLPGISLPMLAYIGSSEAESFSVALSVLPFVRDESLDWVPLPNIHLLGFRLLLT